MDYEVIIGLEVHAELSTATKIFCNCTTEFGGEVNTHCCPVCTGMPGVLPVLNKNVVEYAMKAGVATNCEIASFSKQDRKNYYYPDLPKAYQISQYDLPLCENGFVQIETDEKEKKIGITRIHIEEDAGKLMHDDYGTASLVDYNRCGVPLIEIVSEPDIRSAQEARTYIENLKAILEYIEVSDCKMQEGSLRCDINISVKPVAQEEFGTRAEIKNVNSFRSIVAAIEYETKRQIDIIESGEEVVQETRRWDEDKGITYSMRNKEEAQDYRYFPEPDLMPIVISKDWVENIRNSLPELPNDRKKRYIQQYEIPEYDAGIITSSKHLAEFFDEALKYTDDAKSVSNWIMGDLLRILKEKEMETEDIPFSGEYLAKLVKLIEKGTISGKIAKKVFAQMFEEGKDPETIVEEKGLVQISDENELRQIVQQILSNNSQSVEDYKNGKKKAFGFLVGQAMKETKGKANPQVINKLLAEELNK